MGDRGESVVVGVDGSEAALRAVDWAAQEAAVRRRPLRVVHAFIWPLLHVPVGPAPDGPREGGFRAEAERILAAAADRARQQVPDLEVTTELVTGAAAPVLLAETGRAHLTVLGSRGLGGFTGLVLGSVGVQVSTHAHCPVVVVRGGAVPAADAPVVVGVDGSASGRSAAAFALHEAALHGTGLTAVHVDTGHDTLGVDGGDLAEREQAVLAASVGPHLEAYPQVAVEVQIVRGHPGRALLRAAAGARLIVVGARGLGGFRGMALGSVSQAALHHADAPVAVIREGAAGRPAPPA